LSFWRSSGAGVTPGSSTHTYQGQVFGGAFPSSSTDLYGVACDWSGNVYVADSNQSCIYKFTSEAKYSAADAEGGIYVFAGSPGNDGYVNGRGTDARFKNPRGIVCDRSGNLYVADTGNNRVRKIDKDGYATTIAGGFNGPFDVTVSMAGVVYVADTNNHKIYKIDGGRKLLFAGRTVGNVFGLDGNGLKVQNGAATEPKFKYPKGITMDRSGNLYVSDTGNYQVKKISPDGWVTLYAGEGTKGNVNGKFDVARFVNPIFIEANSSGDLYLIDRVGGKNRLKYINLNGDVASVAYLPGGESLGVEGALGVSVDPSDRAYVVSSLGRQPMQSSSSSSLGSSESSSSISGSTSSDLNSSSSSSSSSSESSETSSLSSKSVSSVSTSGR
jgi:sugar lactone lactonase YvrE